MSLQFAKEEAYDYEDTYADRYDDDDDEDDYDDYLEDELNDADMWDSATGGK